MTISRITLLMLALIGVVIALDENSVIFQIVSFAWAGMVFLWKLVISKLGGPFGIYELLPASIFSSVCIVLVSLLTKAPSREIEEDFETVRTGNVEG